MKTFRKIREKRKHYDLMEMAFKLNEMHLRPGDEWWVRNNLKLIREDIDRLLEEYNRK